jgi:NADH-quinone oxidoreductase subunit N
MAFATIPSSDFLAILPEIGLLLLIGLVLVLDTFRKGRDKNFLGWTVVSGLALILAVKFIFLNPGAEQHSAWGGMLRVDAASYFFQVIILLGALLTVLFSMNQEKFEFSADYLALLLASVIGMNLMAAAADLIMLYLAIETTSIPLYVLAGFIKNDQSSVESGLKYLFFGAMTSAVMLYGFSLLYGFSGSTNLYKIAEVIPSGLIPTGVQILILLLVMAGFGFKISAVPFHFWAPDVYQGAPTPISAFLSTASKGAGFIVLMRFLMTTFSSHPENWMVLLMILSAVTMLVGNLMALLQKDLKRLLAFSSISHAGYILIGVASGSQLGFKAAMYYLLVYLFTNLAAFGVAHIVETRTGSSQISNLKGLIKSSPALAFAFLISILSLSGIPPFGGFISKILVFAAAVEANQTWLVLVGALNSFIGLYYYLNLLRVAFSSVEDSTPVSLTVSWKTALLVCVIGIVVLGIIYTPWIEWLNFASINLVSLY